jgi:hypothetical protein
MALGGSRHRALTTIRSPIAALRRQKLAVAAEIADQW